MSLEHSSFFALSILSPKRGESIATVLLTCGPAGGTHPNPVGACEQLSKVDGRIENIPDQVGVCPLIFDPVIVIAVGVWNGSPRYYHKEFSNQCVANRSTGGIIFDFG
jgi:hypothetical protein